MMRLVALATLALMFSDTTAEVHEDEHDHGHGHAGELCACAQFEADHPFTIDCSDTEAIRRNMTVLQACNGGVPSKAVCAEAEDSTCQIAFFTLQAHHDYCPHDTLFSEEEKYVHDWEAYCLRCDISRQYDPAHFDCPVVDCQDTGPALAAFSVLNSTCTPGDTGTCCTNELTQGAFRTILAYHDLCAVDHDSVPHEVEVGIHDYEHSCENHLCNVVGPDYNGQECPSPPSPPGPPLSSGDGGLDTGALVGIIVACSIAGLLVIFIAYMACREKAGSPIFVSLKTEKESATRTMDEAKMDAEK